MKEYNVGVIGMGFMGPTHMEALRRLGSVRVAAIASSDGEKAKRKAQRWGVPAAYGDYRELLKDGGIDAVHICTPNPLHYPMARDALLAGKHVMCEKPLASTSGEAEALAALCKEKGLLGGVCYNLRFYPLIQQVKAMVAAGELGEIYAVSGSYLQDWLFYQRDYNWRVEGEASATRAVADIGSHWLDMMEHVTGLRIERVCADFATFHKTRYKPLGQVGTFEGKLTASQEYKEVPVDTEDYAGVLLRFAGGARGSLAVSQVAAGRKNRLWFEINGSKQSAAWSGERPNELWLGRRDAPNGILLKDPSLAAPEAREYMGYPGGHAEGYPDTFKQCFAAFYGVLSGEMPVTQAPFASLEDGVRDLKLCERIYQSSREERWITV